MQGAPLHVGIIPDGNRRWARRVGVSLRAAYEAGYRRLREVVDALYARGARYVTVYVLSRDNAVKRPPAERTLVYKLVERGLRDLSNDPKLESRGVAVTILGDPSVVPPSLWRTALSLVEATSGRRGGVLRLLIGYSSRWEVEEARRTGRVPSLELPPVDLVIRTGGWRRLSDFVPLASAYAELYFTNTLWPDFTLSELDEALSWFAGVRRNFGA
jgi:tritrans,polycis-undecaprenyl-diphosphate synthase [geranylgeranyl-diphosphate specific]